MENTSIMKNIFKIHPLVYLFAFIAIFTASFQEFFVISTLICIHEIGHSLAVFLCKGTVKEIMIYPLGGISKFYMERNISFTKEFWILIAGPIFQCLAFLLLMIIFPNKGEMIENYHVKILFFNLLPIYPLDGGKLLFLCFQSIFPWKKSLQVSILIGYFFLLLFFFFLEWKWNLWIMIFLLISLLIKEHRQVSYQYHKFLLERYLYSYSFPKWEIIHHKNDFYREKYHLIEEEEKYYWEEDYFKKHFKKD